MTVVAAVHSIAERLTELDREHAVRLYQPGETSASIDHSRLDDCSGRTARKALRTRTAAVSDRFGMVRRDLRIGHDCTEDDEASGSGDENVARFPPPADPGTVGGGAIDEMVLVGHHDRSMSLGAQRRSDRLERVAKHCIVIFPRVRRHSADGESGRVVEVRGRAVRVQIDDHDVRPAALREVTAITKLQRVGYLARTAMDKALDAEPSTIDDHVAVHSRIAAELPRVPGGTVGPCLRSLPDLRPATPIGVSQCT